MRTSSLKNQLVLLLALSSLAIVVGITVILTVAFGSLRMESVKQYRASIELRYDTLIKSQTQEAVSLLQFVWSRRKDDASGIIDCRNVLRSLRYLDDKSGYFWADTYDGVNMVHATKPEIEGKSRMDSKDSTGKYLIREIIRNGFLANGGFTNYRFTRDPADPADYPKRGYSLAVPELRWVIGTGNYVDEIDRDIARYDMSMQNTFNAIYAQFIVVAIGLLIAFSIILFIFNLRIFESVFTLTAALRRLTRVDADLDYRIPEHGPRELVECFQQYNLFVEGIRSIFLMFLEDGRKIQSTSDGLLKRLQGNETRITQVATAAQNLAKRQQALPPPTAEQTVAEIKKIQQACNVLADDMSELIGDAKKRNELLDNSLREVKRFKLEKHAVLERN